MPILETTEQNIFKNTVKQCENLVADLLDSIQNSTEPAFAEHTNLYAAFALLDALKTTIDRAKGI